MSKVVSYFNFLVLDIMNFLLLIKVELWLLEVECCSLNWIMVELLMKGILGMYMNRFGVFQFV